MAWLRRRPAAGAALFAALAAGVLHSAGFAPLGAWPLQLLAVALLACLVGTAPPAAAAWRGAAFGTGWLLSGLWWLYISMHDYGGMPAPLAALGVLLLCLALSLYLAGAMALFAWRRRGRPLADAALFSACWLLAELARAQWLTGFPWLAAGYAHSDGPLSALAPWVGVYGMGAVAAWLAFAAARGVAAAAGTRRPAPAGRQAQGGRQAALALALGAGLPLAAWLAPSDFTVPAGTLRLSLLQPNVPQDLKFDPRRMAQNMAALQAQILAAPGELVVTPESVLPVPRAQLDPAFWQALTAPYRAPGRALLIGTFLGDDEAGYVNSVVGVAGPGPEYTYGKRHLLPFGEFVPAGFRWFVDLMHIPLGDQARGRSDRPFAVGDQAVRPLICYENLFGEEMAASAGTGPHAATVLVNVSNLAWFGRHLVQDQDLQFSRLRALEFQRPVARATNTGSTALVDHTGQVSARLPAGTHATLDATVEGRRGATPYARWLAAAGLLPLWGLALAGVLLAGRRSRR